VADRKKSVCGIEPVVISMSSKHRAALSNKVLKLTQQASGFRMRLQRT
jgi:hypothetical protein